MVCGFSVGSMAFVMFLCLFWPRAHSDWFSFLSPACVCVCVWSLVDSSKLSFSVHPPTAVITSQHTCRHNQTQMSRQLWESWPCLKCGAGTPIRFVLDKEFTPLGPSPSAAARLAHLTRVPGSCSLQKVLKIAQTWCWIILIKLNSALLRDWKCFFICYFTLRSAEAWAVTQEGEEGRHLKVAAVKFFVTLDALFINHKNSIEVDLNVKLIVFSMVKRGR